MLTVDVIGMEQVGWRIHTVSHVLLLVYKKVVISNAPNIRLNIVPPSRQFYSLYFNFES